MTARSRFLRSLGLGAALLLLVHVGLCLSDVQPLVRFGGWRLARKFDLLCEARARGPIEVLGIGPSYMDTGFDAQAFEQETGQAAFNFGVGGVDLWTQSVLLRDVLLPLVEPGTLFWSVHDSPFVNRRMTFQYRDAPFVRDGLGRERARAAVWKRRLPANYRRPLAQWVEGLEEPAANPIDAWGHTANPSTLRGDREDDGEEDEAGGVDALNLTPEDTQALTEEAFAAFEEALAHAHARGTRVFVLLMPFHRSAFEARGWYRRRARARRFGDYRERLLAIAERQGALFVNRRWDEELSEDDDLFFDYRHLNAVGARRFTAELVRLWRGEEVPAEWHEAWSRTERRATGR
jgi:hypothetical protein